MGQCQYKNLQGEHTCNIDTQLFKDKSQEDLFPDFCYFHQIGCVFFDIYRVLYHNTINLGKPLHNDELKSENNTNIKNFRYETENLPDKKWLSPYSVKPVIINQNKVEHEGTLIEGLSVIDLNNGIRKIDVSDPDGKRRNDIFILWYFKIMQFNLPNLIDYYSKFDNLMSSKDYQDIEINTDGFYFPVAKYNAPIKFTAKKAWVNKLNITNNLFVYEYSVFDNEINFNSNTMTYYLKGYYEHYGNFTSSYSSGNDIYKIEFVNITFENDIQSKRIESNKGEYTTNISIDFSGCIFNSSIIDTHTDNIDFVQNTIITNKNLDLRITATQSCFIKKSKVESKNITIKSASLNIEYTELHSDNTEKIELHVPFNKIILKNPFGMKRLFGKKAIVDIYDG